MAWLGFTDVQRNSSGTITSTEPERLPSYILTRSADSHGRCVAFAVPGDAAGWKTCYRR